jgi:hypothetical protein
LASGEADVGICPQWVESRLDRIGDERQEASRHPPPPDSWRRFPPALSSLAMPARHCHHDSTERRKLFTITLESCSRSAGSGVHDAVETVITMSRNMQDILAARSYIDNCTQFRSPWAAIYCPASGREPIGTSANPRQLKRHRFTGGGYPKLYKKECAQSGAQKSA